MANNVIKKTLNRRVFILFGGFTLLLSIFYLGLSLLIAYVVEDDIMEKLLNDEKDFVIQQYQLEKKLVKTRMTNIDLYWFENDEYYRLPKEIKEVLEKNPHFREVFTKSNKTHYHLLPFELEDNQKAILVANVMPFLVVTSMSKGMLYLSLIFVILFLSVSLFLAYRLARFIVLPIENLTNEINQKAETDFSQPSGTIRFSSSELDNEIGYLGRSLQSAFNQLNESYEREYHFTRDLSHELRTPLTVIKNQITIERNKGGQIAGESLEMLNAEVDKMKRIIDVLIALARKESVSKENINIRGVIEEATISRMTIYPRLDVEVGVDDATQVFANRQLLLMMIVNLIENAARYSANQSLLIEYSASQLSLKNNLPETDKKASQEHESALGQGLYLVERICEKLSWQVSHQLNHTQFVIRINFKESLF